MGLELSIVLGVVGVRHVAVLVLFSLPIVTIDYSDRRAYRGMTNMRRYE